jgi:3-hydroxyisobutyrate dehydrogenase-like beta-hydroxyacid dehydrogenase
MGEVSVIGMGAMGSALARALLHNGHRVTVWNRTSAKAEPLARDGADLAPALRRQATERSRLAPSSRCCVGDRDV